MEQYLAITHPQQELMMPVLLEIVSRTQHPKATLTAQNGFKTVFGMEHQDVLLLKPAHHSKEQLKLVLCILLQMGHAKEQDQQLLLAMLTSALKPQQHTIQTLNAKLGDQIA